LIGWVATKFFFRTGSPMALTHAHRSRNNPARRRLGGFVNQCANASLKSRRENFVLINATIVKKPIRRDRRL
jgi:hypothetical protein